MAGIEEIRANLSAATTQASEALYALKQAALTINEVQRALDTTVASSARESAQHAISAFHQAFSQAEQAQELVISGRDSIDTYAAQL
ncbi:hypothetical protein A8924_1531 [Saccharopolyspora erythraea NRRL 2338]|uniref:Uncharacterized protein n=2 Tax=Saccharopolyspora erythraea TaxID=1836 RepID=A4F8U0_SACEN|nr:hypothetical protein [Saccharopolyspora erythraea]EQD86781.1 hypothetical protein N599_07955 [Saccharopolyspora erythraea D]PFG94260.1 hypothetical protein A8924_1531 [Saccharopolyspora erythraea NRRL 2338]QRK91032.1 hypothetical protein JQX30_06200 [Saccharopolyspora erythraea]CAM00465.1 hypothetical protein SACE_1134 [Saccharopolyspora erythraea NRRL 2338]